jgi:hypothetical protein
MFVNKNWSAGKMSNRRDFLRRMGIGAGVVVAAPSVLGSQLSSEIPARTLIGDDIFPKAVEMPVSEYDFVIINYELNTTDNARLSHDIMRLGCHEESGTLEMYCYGEFLQKFMNGTINNESIDLVLPLPNMDAVYRGEVRFSSMSIQAPSMAEDMIITADFFVMGSMEIVMAHNTKAAMGKARGKHGNKGKRRS